MDFLVGKIGSYLTNIVRNLYYAPLQARRCRPWFQDNGDKTLRLDYPLTDTSVVFDLGGYEGQWASDIFSKYCCHVHIFEPVLKFSSQIEQRFAKNNKISVHPFGLSNTNQTIDISIQGDSSSSFMNDGKAKEIINLIKAVDFIQSSNITSIDLMKINIEGAEYDLLEHLIENKFVENIKDIQVQFHDFVPNAEARMKNIQAGLSKTHYLTYQYPFVWENWRKL